MPITVTLTQFEAAALRDAGHDLVGSSFEYDPRKISEVLDTLPEGDARQRLGERFASVAAQLNIPETMFTEVIQESLGSNIPISGGKPKRQRFADLRDEA